MAYVDTDGKNRGLKGYVDYLEQLDKEIVGDSQAMRVLDRFKKGDWRDLVLEELEDKSA